MLGIKSKDNSKFKLAKSLLKSKYRNKENKFLAEGLRTVELAIEYKADIEWIFVSRYFQENENNAEKLEHITKEYQVYVIDNDLFEQLSSTENSQGIIAVMNMKKIEIDVLNEKKHKKILVLDRLQDPGNVGTIVRTADAAGFDLVIVNKGCVDVYNPKVVRSAMGSIFYMDIVFAEDEEIFNVIKSNNIELVSSSLETDSFFDQVSYGEFVALVLGNEANGISDFWKNNADKLVKIPMYGKAESLNVAISSAILMYSINSNIKKS